MSAPVTSPSSARTVNKANTQKPRAQPLPRKTRIVRRRGRAKGGIESDDEIERELGTDSESDDNSSSLNSATEDSDTEPASEDAPANGHLHSPASGKIVPPLRVDGTGHLNQSVEPFFAPTSSWSDMVADENAHGSASLPVIDFSQFDSATSIPARQAKKLSKPRAVTSPSEHGHPQDGPDEQGTHIDEEPRSQANFVSVPRRKSGQTARQAYQQRLESDPSYVPTVGGFWGHDDRLMEKDLRSLSGWWRGRWQGRGRGRGFVIRGDHYSHPNGENSESNSAEVAAVDRPWTHDGFEEMKRKEDHRRAVAEPAQRPESHIIRGRGGFRGGRGRFAAGPGREFGRRFSSSSTSTRGTSPSTPQRRVWFMMKPELTWSKQNEAFLFFDHTFKFRGGQLGYQVKLPGSRGHTARSNESSQSQTRLPNLQEVGSESFRPDNNDGVFIPRVRLPKLPTQEEVHKEVELGIVTEDIFTVRPHLAETKPLSGSEPTLAPSVPDINPPPTIRPRNLTTSQVVPELSVVHQLEQFSTEPQMGDLKRQAKTEEAVLREPVRETAHNVKEAEIAPADQRPTLAPLQTVFTPPPPISQPSPVYGSPYTYAHVLPPGIAMNQQGMPYEVATGRPVYLQAPTLPIYNPQPLLHSHLAPAGIPYVPGHMRHPSAISPDFLSQPPRTPPMNGFIDPSTGTPIFSFPRQTTRIEIRAPTEDHGKLSKILTRGPSRLRTSATTFQPTRQSDIPESNIYPTINAPSEVNALLSYETRNGISGDEASQHIGATMLTYPAYQPQYYYPESYGYPHYMDMPQSGQYDMYNMDHQAPQGTVYY